MTITRRQVLGGAALAALAATTSVPSAAAPRQLLNGSDVSWLPDVERAGGKFYTAAGRSIGALALLRRQGGRLGRVRVFVDAADGNGSLSRALKLARRLKSNGLAICLDLHYSDTWADPAHQSPPAAWSTSSLPALTIEVEQYTDWVLGEFSAAGCAPQYVQLGNEITNGMLWPAGRVNVGSPTEWRALARLQNTATRVLRRRLPRARSVLHLDCGGDASRVNWWLANAGTYGLTDFDLVGLSYYSQWHGGLNQLAASLRLVAQGYRKPVVIAETAYPWTEQTFGGDIIDVSRATLPGYPATPAGQAAFLDRLQSMLRALPVNRGVGVWWWEGLATCVSSPDGSVSWNGGMANSALVRPNGRALPALGRMG